MSLETPPPPYYQPATEETSLLSRKQSPKGSTKSKIAVAFVVYFLLFSSGFVGFNLYYLAPKADQYINKAVEFEVERISVTGLSNDGIQVRVEGTNRINYEHVNNSYISKVLSVGGFLLHKLTIDIDEIELAMNDDSNSEFFRLGLIHIPKFTVLTNNNSFTHVELNPTIKPDTVEILRVLRKLLKDPESMFTLKGLTHVTIYSGFIPLGKFPFDFNKNIPNIKFNLSDITIESFQFTESEDSSLVIDVASAVKNPLRNEPFSFQVNKYSWDFFVNDCYDIPSIKIASGESSGFEVSPQSEKLHIHLKSSMTEVPKDLSMICDDNRKSPMDFIVNKLFHENEISFVVKGNEHNEFLSDISIPVNYKLPSNNLTSNLIENVTLTNMDVSFEKGPEEPLLSGTVEAFVNLPDGFDLRLDITDLKGKANLYYQSEKLGYVFIEDWVEATTSIIKQEKHAYLFVRSDLEDLPIIVEDRSLFSDMVGDILMKGSVAIDINALLDVIVKTVLGSLQIDEIPGSGNTVISKGLGLINV